MRGRHAEAKVQSPKRHDEIDYNCDIKQQILTKTTMKYSAVSKFDIFV